MSQHPFRITGMDVSGYMVNNAPRAIAAAEARGVTVHFKRAIV